MENVLKQIGVFLGEQFARVLGEFTGHTENHEIHKSSAEIRSEITEEDVPDSIARDTEVNMKIQTHNASGEAHQDIRKAITDIKNVECSEYAVHLGTEGDSYTKAQLDSKINKHIKGVSYDQGSAKFTFTFEDGTVAEVDTPVENTVKDARYDAAAGEFVLVLVSGAEIRIAAAGMVKTYSGAATATATVAVSAEGVISADLKEGGVDMIHLSEVLRDALNSYQTKAGDTKDNITTFAEAVERENIESGESHSILFGKIRKWFSSLGGLAFRDSVEPLNVIYENGEKVIYQGSEGQSILIPGSGRKVLIKGLNVHGYWEAKEYENFSMSILLVGIPDFFAEPAPVFVEKVYYDKTELSWKISSEFPMPRTGPFSFQYDLNMMNQYDEGYFRFAVYYEDPVSLVSKVLYSDIVYLQIVTTKKDIVPLDNIGFAEGYKIVPYNEDINDVESAEVNFKLYRFSEEATAALLELVNGEWVSSGAPRPTEGYPYVCYSINKVGRYKVIITDKGVETSSGEFVVKRPMSLLYVVTEYPEDLTKYPDGTIFIKNPVV